MNFLAHAYLSFGHSEILTGNMMSDFVKGKKRYEHPDLIQKGIVLHRLIDDFTDAHHSTKAIKQFFKSDYGLYSAVFTDVVYDYFLANDINEFSNEIHLGEFVSETFDKLTDNQNLLELSFQSVFIKMKEQNWLFHYREIWGIEKSFTGIARRAKYFDSSDKAFEIFKDNIENMRPFYEVFFPDVKRYAKEQFDRLLSL